MTVRPIGVIGLGLVGTAISELLLERGFAVAGYDVREVRRQHLSGIGGTACGSPADVAARCSRVILCVFDDDDIERALWGEAGLLTAAGPSIVISTTTSDPDRVADVSARAGRAGVALLDATISGSSVQVRQHDSVMMIGGAAQAVEQCGDLFDALAKQWFHVGEAGAGARSKLVVNLVLGLNRAALGEGIAYAERLGLDARAMLGVLKASAAYSQIMDIKGEKMLARDYTPQGRLAQHAKDVKLILATAARLGMRLPLSAVHDALLQQAIADGDAEIDNAGIVEVTRRQRFQGS